MTPASFVAASPILMALATGPVLAQSSSTPTTFAAGIVSTDAIEYAATFTPGGDTVVFTRRTSFDDPPRLWMAHRVNGRWTDGGMVSFSGIYADEYPSFSPDGTRLYFASTRPARSDTAARSANAMWVVALGSNGWSSPREVIVDGLGDVMASHPAVGPDGSLYFHSNRPGGAGRVDAYRARPAARGFGPPELLPFSSSAVDGEIGFGRGGRLVVFYSDRDGGLGKGDLYFVLRTGSGWSDPVNVGPPVSSSEWEWTPSFSPDGTQLFFARLNAAFDRSDIFVVDVTAVSTLQGSH